MTSAVTETTPNGPGPAHARWPAGWLVAAIRGYQLARSGRPSGCRYLPSCSEYAVEAIGTHGAVRGGGMALRRLLRCHPWGGHGVDPVPRVPRRPHVSGAPDERDPWQSGVAPEMPPTGACGPREEIPCRT